ncbi:2Fe-2S iron-sulfur cluster-binding protein [Streptomyces sp. NBC_00083]|uniref:2Fe-2S iron-sulfur cluster-binding protein n=1 Tax=Streptomyces sp. NBC_00083 TaxID=2975647 RepID=UPI00225426B0|nr:2Fe-2S iron-sulfur cluster-binding protein [Streptomyces sp. NBC_00083]MCX5384127.1 2Fe-2S iron-sulfur cluster-binding protein [Streptomyces sp. NBC_00083]
MEPRHGLSDGGPAPGAQTEPGATESQVTLRVNDITHRVELDHRVTLLECLRDNLGLTGSGRGCDDGGCEACAVLIDGRRVASCLLLAIGQEGREIVTIEGLAAPVGPEDDRHPLRSPGPDRDTARCGYCAPGMPPASAGTPAGAGAGQSGVVSEMDLPAEAAVQLTAVEVREQLSGNLCRCGAYPSITEALQDLDPRGPDTQDADARPAPPQEAPPQGMAIQEVTT